MAEINPDIKKVLQESNINVSLGILALLGIYHKLDIETICTEEVIKSINLTHIVDREYTSKGAEIKWNLPLYAGEENDFGWVQEWFEPFGKKNPARRGNLIDCKKRMKDFFAKYPQYRKEDVFKARDEYFKSVRDPEYLMLSYKFIFDGVGVMRKSTLLSWCEKLEQEESTGNNNIKGKIGR